MSKTILIVEDFDDVRQAVQIMLELHGYRVIEATDGHEAVEMARIHRPDLILMDISMPAFDGISATREIRTFSELAATPIIAVTSHGDQYRSQALEAGCNDVVHKTKFMQDIPGFVRKYLP